MNPYTGSFSLNKASNSPFWMVSFTGADGRQKRRSTKVPHAVGPIIPGQPFAIAGYTYAPVNTAPSSRATCATYVTPGQPLTIAGYTYAPVNIPPQARPAYAAQPTPNYSYPWYDTADTASPWSIEIAAAANLATRPIMRAYWEENAPKVNTYGADITISRTLIQDLSANIRLGFASGKDSFTEGDFDMYAERYKVTDFTIMPGLRYTFQLAPSFAIYLGANIGILSRSLKCREFSSSYYYISLDEPPVSSSDTTKWHDSTFAFAYSAEIGLRCNITPHLALFAAYQISGSSARPKRAPQYKGEESYSSPCQYYNTIRAGISCTF